MAAALAGCSTRGKASIPEDATAEEERAQEEELKSIRAEEKNASASLRLNETIIGTRLAYSACPLARLNRGLSLRAPRRSRIIKVFGVHLFRAAPVGGSAMKRGLGVVAGLLCLAGTGWAE